MRFHGICYGLLLFITLVLSPCRSAAEPAEIGRKLTQWRGGGGFLSEHAALRLAARSGEGRSAFIAKLQLLRFYLGWALEREALAVAEEIKAQFPDALQDGEFTLLGDMAAIMADRLPGGDAFFARIGVANAQDAPLWRAVALAQRSEWRQALAHVEIAASQVGGYPQVYAERFLPLLMEAALDAKDARVARSVAHRIAGFSSSAFDQARTGWLAGRLAELEGYPEAALERYRRAADLSGPWAVRAELGRISLEMARGGADLAEAETKLRTLLVLWRGDRIEQLVLMQLASVLERTGRVDQALASCATLVRRFPLSPMALAAREKAGELLRRIYVERRTDALDAASVLGLRDRHAELMPAGEPGTAIDRGYAQMLIESGLTIPAHRVLEGVIGAGDPDEETSELILRLAERHLQDGVAATAVDLLQRHPQVFASPAGHERYRLLQARALAALGRSDEASAMLARLSDPDALRSAGDAFWLARDWGRAETAYRRLFAALPENAATADEVGRHAVSALMAGDAATAAALYRRFRPLLDGSHWGAVLSGSLHAENTPGDAAGSIPRRLADMQAVADMAARLADRH